MGQTLTNGLYLPDEGERNCYSGLESNWRALDAVVGGYNTHIANLNIHVTTADKNSWNGHVANGDIHVTASDKTGWNNHVANNDIHVTAADKTGWNNHVGNSDIHVTAADKTNWNGKADDTGVVHKSGEETVAGLKTFSDLMSIDGDYLGTEASTNQRTNLQLRSNRDTAGKSGALMTRFRQDRSQGGLLTGDLQMLGFDFLENEVRTNNVLSVQATGWADSVPTKVNIVSGVDDYSYGTSARPCKINGISPEALSMPNLSAGVDISGYLTNAGTTTPSEYTPTVNGWIVIKTGAASGVVSLRAYSDGGLDNYAYSERSDICDTAGSNYARFTSMTIPCIANDKVNIIIMPSTVSVISAKFYPCAGNV